MLVQDGNISQAYTFGHASAPNGDLVDSSTTFHWASITKTLTAIAIMQLRDRGRLTLDDPAVRYLPELSLVHDPFGPVEAISIRELLTHTAGFRGPSWPWGGDAPWQPFEPTSWSQIVATLPYTEVEFQPGSRFSYSNLGYVFLGEIIERLTGGPVAVYLDKNILRPLHMYESYFNRSPYFLLRHRSHSYGLSGGQLSERRFDFDTGITVANSGLNAPLSDMAKYVAFLAGTESENGGQVLRRESLEEMYRGVVMTNHPSESLAGAPDPATWMGLGFFVGERNGVRLISHGGSQNGFISHIYVQPKSKRGYVIAFNTEATDQRQSTLLSERALRECVFQRFLLSRK